MEKLSKFNMVVLNGIMLKDGFNSIDDVVSRLCKDHIDKHKPSNKKRSFTENGETFVSYTTQGTDNV